MCVSSSSFIAAVLDSSKPQKLQSVRRYHPGFLLSYGGRTDFSDRASKSCNLYRPARPAEIFDHCQTSCFEFGNGNLPHMLSCTMVNDHGTTLTLQPYAA